MKYNIFKSLLACGALMAFASCSENSWNDEYLDGFETPSVYPDKQSAQYELLAKDYKTIASLQENIDKATAAGVLDQLEALAPTDISTMPSRQPNIFPPSSTA